MMMLRITAIFLCTCLITIRAAEPENRVIIGMDPALSAGADALRSGDYQEGLDLTLDGLDSTMTSRNRANAFSNLCAGYLGIADNANALEACDKALEFNDRNWRIYNNRALALLGAGRLAAALGDVEKGLALNPDSRTLAKVARLIDAQASHRLVATGRDMDRH
jgi:tetratricopeptide (TPR) repeat protein